MKKAHLLDSVLGSMGGLDFSMRPDAENLTSRYGRVRSTCSITFTLNTKKAHLLDSVLGSMGGLNFSMRPDAEKILPPDTDEKSPLASLNAP
jgi:hypothetical protein